MRMRHMHAYFPETENGRRLFCSCGKEAETIWTPDTESGIDTMRIYKDNVGFVCEKRCLDDLGLISAADTPRSLQQPDVKDWAFYRAVWGLPQ